MGERSCHIPEGKGSDLSLSQKVDEMMTMLQTMRSEIAEMKNMLTDALYKNNKENDDEEVCHRGTMTQYSRPVHVATTTPPQFPFSSAAAAAATTIMQQQPSFGTTHGDPHFTFVSASSVNNDQMQQQPVQSNSVLGVGTSTPIGATPFQFGCQKNNIPSPIFQASGGSEFNAEEEEGFCDRPGRSSTTAAGAADSMPKVLESDNTDAKTNIAYGFSARASEPAFSSAASTSFLTSPTDLFSFGNSSNKNNGSAVSSPTFSSPFPPMVANNLTSQNIFSGSSLATSCSIISATATSTSTSMTTSTPAVIASSNSSSSTPVTASSSSTTSLFKFGSTPLPSTSLPVSSSGSEPVETKSGQDAGIGNIGSTSFGSSSAAVGSTGSGIFGFSSSATTSVNSQSQGSVFGTTSGSTPGTLAPSATSGFATSNQSQSVAFGSSASSPLFGFTGNTTFSSVSSSFPSSSPATNIFNSGTTSGQSTSASSLEANPVSSNNGTSSTLFGLSSWQPSNSPFGTSFSSSSSSTSGFSFTSSNPVTSTSSPMIFGSSTGASGPQLSFTSAVATPNIQPAFGSPPPVFAFGSASANNDQMSMEDSMAEDTVQATPPPVTPVFGQQPAPVQSNFVFGASTPAAASPFQLGSQQSIAPQNPSPFQASGCLEFNAGGSISLGTGGVDKSGRKFVIVQRKQRKK